MGWGARMELTEGGKGVGEGRGLVGCRGGGSPDGEMR